MEKMKKMK